MNVKQVRAFLALGNFYRCFIKDYTIISRPMVDLTCKDVIFNFGDKEKASFKALKAAFTTAPVLQYPIRTANSASRLTRLSSLSGE